MQIFLETSISPKWPHPLVKKFSNTRTANFPQTQLRFPLFDGRVIKFPNSLKHFCV